MRLPLLILHILGGTVGLLAGAFAMAVRKGSRLHRASGNVFTIAMLTLASSALPLAIMKSQRGNVIGSIITFYMIVTAWLAGRRRNIGPADWTALLVGLGGAAAVITGASPELSTSRNPRQREARRALKGRPHPRAGLREARRRVLEPSSRVRKRIARSRFIDSNVAALGWKLLLECWRQVIERKDLDESPVQSRGSERR